MLSERFYNTLVAVINRIPVVNILAKKVKHFLCVGIFEKKYKKHFETVEIEKILVGQQSGTPLDDWVELTNEFNRVSMSLVDSPYVNFLKAVDCDETILNDYNRLSVTSYYKMSEIVINEHGNYFGAKNSEELEIVMNDYYKFYKNYISNNNGDGHEFYSQDCHSKTDEPIMLNKIKQSDCYEVVDGHHRLAIKYLKGEKKIRALIVNEKHSYLQKIILAGRQTHGDCELYQPINRNEVKNWRVVRKCSDRFQLIDNFLKQNFLYNQLESLVDISCSYGWFANEFKKKGFKVLGVDNDQKVLKIGKIVFGLEDEELFREDAYDFLLTNEKKYDVVLFLSIFHHYAIKKEKGEISVILKKLDKMTNKILIFDTGQSHEKWFSEKLTDWNDDYIIKLVKRHTNFKEFIKLGVDTDNVGLYKDQYRRSLFVFVK